MLMQLNRQVYVITELGIKMKNILVVGGAGYIGSHTVRHLQQKGYQCIVFDNLVYGHKASVVVDHFVEGDLSDKSAIQRVFDQYEIEAVVHFAAYAYVGESVKEPQKYYFNNVVGTLNLLEVMLANKVNKIVFSSTCASYGEPQYTPIDEFHPQQPINPYGTTKLVIEKVLADYQKAYGLQYIALRYFNAAGASADGFIGESHAPETHLIPLVLKAITGENPSIKVFGTDYPTPDGTCIRDYIHVEDLASAHRLALEKLNHFQGCLNLGTGVGTSVKEIIEAAELVSGKQCPVIYEARREGDPAALYAANTKAVEVLGWQPQYMDIKDIIQTAWHWENHRRY